MGEICLGCHEKSERIRELERQLVACSCDHVGPDCFRITDNACPQHGARWPSDADEVRRLRKEVADLRAALYGARSTRCICQTWRGSRGGTSSLERGDCPVHGQERRGA